jgi:hypothetical protein
VANESYRLQTKDLGDQLRASVLVPARRDWLDHIGGYPNNQRHREPAPSFRLDLILVVRLCNFPDRQPKVMHRWSCVQCG